MDEMEKLKDVLVVQSNKLIEASYRLRMGQQKFLRLMASMIKKDDEDFKIYEFKIADVMKLFDVKNKSNYTEIPRQLRELMGNVLTFTVGKTTTIVPFLILAQHDEGSGVVRVQFHPILKPMYLCLNKENPFTIYELSNALKLRSVYSLRFYELLKQYQKIGHRVLNVEYIRELFKLQATEYTRYNDFKRKIILRAQKELSEKTDICFNFEEMKTGRKVTSLKFYIRSNVRAIDEVSVTKEENNTSKEGESFVELINTTKSIFKENITDLEAKKLLDASKGNINIIMEKYILSQNVPKINNVVGWMLSAIKEDYKAPAEKAKTNTFSNFKQRDYDFKDLEKKLLGWND